MNLPTEIFGQIIVVHAPEELGADQAAEFEAYLPRLDRQWIVLDLDHTETLDSAGLGAILNAQDALREAGGDVKLATSNPINRKILEITRLDHQAEVFDSVVDAMKSFQ